MALFSPAKSFSKQGPADLGRCGQPFHYDPTLIVEDAPATQASDRLFAAATFGDAVQLIRCVADGADPNFVDLSNGETPLHRAVQRNHLGVVEVLVSVGADMNRFDHVGRTPLYFAASRGSINLVAKLLSVGAKLFPTDQDISSNSDASHSTGTQYTNHNSPSASNSADITENSTEADDAAFLALRTTCPLAAAAAAGRWSIVTTLLMELPSDYMQRPAALRSLRFLVWALACHRAFPREVIDHLPPTLPRCVIDAVRPAHLASTPLVLATGNDQQQLMQWLLQQGADPELGAPLLLCAGRFCRGSRTCCVSTLLRRGARPHVAWTDNPNDSPLRLAAAGDCFTHVHCLVTYGADVNGEAARVRQALYLPAPWEAHLDRLMQQFSDLAAAPGADLLCLCGQQHARWSGLWPQDTEDEDLKGSMEGPMQTEAVEAGSGGNSCQNLTPADDAWYRCHCAQMAELQDGNELAECRKAVDELWHYGCSAVISELGGTPSVPHSLMPQRILTAMQDVAGGWLIAAARCRQQRELRADLYDKAVAAGRAILDKKRIFALSALSVAHRSCSSAISVNQTMGESRVPLDQHQQLLLHATQSHQGLMAELKMEILALAGLAPAGIEPRTQLKPGGTNCCCQGCRD